MNHVASPPPSRRPGVLRIATLLTVAAALTWLIAHVFFGLDFTDEMQYYGEIASLVRTGRFFQDDLFVQQLGYILVLPFFKLHQLFFPDLAYLVLFGRLLLLAAYAAVGFLFWRAATRAGFSRQARLAGLAAFLAWVPFQVFAFGYNSMSYLLIVALGAIWLGDNRTGFRSFELPLSVLLAALGLVYPPAGLVLAFSAVGEAIWRRNLRAGLRLLATLLGCGGLLGAAVVGLHGWDFFSDLGVALAFSRAFGVGEVILLPTHLLGLAALIAGGGVLVGRLRDPTTPAVPPVVATAGLILSLAALLGLSLRGAIGYAATGAFVFVLIILRTTARPADRARAAELATVGLVLGAVFAGTSGNGVHNFGLGAIGLVPLLVLYASRATEGSEARDALGTVRRLLPTAAAALLLLNGALHPYREQRMWHDFVRVREVPAFRGIGVSPIKAEALDIFRQFSRQAGLAGKSVLIAGPHAWIYFVARAEPNTAMFFMHFSGQDAVYQIVADRLFQRGPPAAVLLTTATPPALHRRIMAWTQPGVTAQTLVLPADFIQRYQQQTGYDFTTEVVLLTRSRPTP